MGHPVGWLLRYVCQGDGGEADAFAVPGVGDVEFAVFALDDGGIGVLAGLVFESGEDFEVLAVGADGEIEWGSACGGVVVDEDDAAVAEAYGVDAGVGVGEVGGVGLGPGEAVVEGVGDADAADVGGGAGVEAEMFFAERDDGGLDDSGDVFVARSGCDCCGAGWDGDGAELRPCFAVVGAAIDP